MDNNQATPPVVSRPQASTPSKVIGGLALLLGVLAFATVFLPAKLAFFVLGSIVVLMGVLQNATGFALRDMGVRGMPFARGSVSIVTGLLLIAMPKLSFAGLALLLGLSWFVSGASEAFAAVRRRESPDWYWQMIDGVVNLLLGAAIAVQWPLQGVVSIGLFLGLRYVSAGWAILLGSRRESEDGLAPPEGLHPDARLGLAPHPYIARLCEQLGAEELVCSRRDRAWRWLFLFTFFAIHVARMDAEWTLVGMLSPLGAVLGDVALSVVVGYGLVAPLMATWGFTTRGLERRAWPKYLAGIDQAAAPTIRSRLTGWWLTRRLRAAVRTSQTRGSATAAVGWGLQAGLPVAAILIAVTPLWGISWVFNTETWVTGGWELWAEQRTDDWRIAMVDAVKKKYGEEANDPNFFRVHPEGLDAAGDFSFIVIGDTGEGDASQNILRDQLILLGQKPEVKFLVLSSDVIYPSGAMKDYEPKFYLPFKGFNKPIYAVPGNHDWYDALEAFTANFFEPKAARAAMRGRRELDLRLTTTTEQRIVSMVEQATRLREAYEIKAAGQRAPYFEIHTDAFSLIVVDTGILRRVDEDQMRWLDEALTRAGGKFTMVILGHPLYAAGHYQAQNEEAFARVHELLKKHGVPIVMAGDTHDFEFYKENYNRGGKEASMHHFVNGGGGAYLSIGTALSWPSKPPVNECGFYPRKDQLIASLNASTPAWKQPIWYWVRDLGAWPSTPEGFAAAFNYDQAPFFQSFIEVRVEPSKGRVLLWLHGSNGRLRWQDLHVQDGRIPGGQAAGDLVEFAFPMIGKKGG